MADDPFNPPQVPMDPFMTKLVTDRAAWGWWVRGYGTGYEQGHAAGYAAGYDDAMRILDEASALLATHRPDKVIPIQRLRRIRTEYATPALSAEQIRRRAAESWAEIDDISRSA